MPLILLTNDDGIDAPGLSALEDSLQNLGEVWTIAPHRERSACARSVTLHRPLRVVERGKRRLAVDGMPADCVLLAFRAILDRKPDVLISGINNGYNLGEDLDYSGTVAAAAEGALQGAKSSLAISVAAGSSGPVFQRAATVARTLAKALMEQSLPRSCFLNINMPPEESRRLCVTRQGNPLPPGEVEQGVDPRGGNFYWIGNRPDEADPPPDTDRGAIKRGHISATLLTLDRTCLGDWPVPRLGNSDIRVEDLR